LKCKENGFQHPHKIRNMQQQQQPFIQKSWIRVLLFLLCYLFLLLLSGNLWEQLPETIRNGKDLPVPFLYLPLLYNFIAGSVLVIFFRKAFDRQSLSSLGFVWKQFGRERLAGVLTATALLCGIASVLWWMQLLKWYTLPVPVLSLLLVSGLMILVAAGEELVFRGYVLNNLLEGQRKPVALFFSALAFALFHSLNPEFNLSAFLNILLAGILTGLNYLYTRNLWFGICFHFTWNWLQGPVLGFTVSGLELPSLLQQDLNGSVLLTGGAFGLEASWLTTVLLMMALPLLHRLFLSYYRR